MLMEIGTALGAAQPEMRENVVAVDSWASANRGKQWQESEMIFELRR